LYKGKFEVLRGFGAQLLNDKFADSSKADYGYAVFH
jgi:hypothetical protein